MERERKKYLGQSGKFHPLSKNLQQEKDMRSCFLELPTTFIVKLCWNWELLLD